MLKSVIVSWILNQTNLFFYGFDFVPTHRIASGDHVIAEINYILFLTINSIFLRTLTTIIG